MFENPTAFSPFYDATAKVSGDRRETGASAKRLMLHSVPCCVLGGGAAELPSGAVTPSIERAYDVLIRRADWPDHKPPQAGDVLTVEGYPELRCLSCHPDGTDWVLACNSKGVLP